MRKLPQQDGFCVLPWLSICGTVEGVWSRCCIDRSVYSGEKPIAGGKLAHDALGCVEKSPFAEANRERVFTLHEAFNSDNMKKTRLAMLKGEPVDACYDCHRREKMGALSYRENMNAQFGDLDWDARLKATDETGAVVGAPIFLDLRLGNFCNLRCTMCSWPTSSSHGIGTSARLEPYGDNFFQEFATLANHIERIYFAGGEPLLQPGHHRAIEALIASGRAPAIDLVYNTNLTVLPKWCIEAWAKFRSVDLGVSCDGVGELFETIRQGARWSRLVQNIKRVRAKNISIRLAVTVQRANARGILPLVDWANDNGLSVDLSNVLLFPEEMSLERESSEGLAELCCDLDVVIKSSTELGVERSAREGERLKAVVGAILAQRVAA